MGFAVTRGRVRRGGRWRTGGLVSILSVRVVRGFLLSAQLAHFLCPFLLSFDVLLDLRDGADILMCARLCAGSGRARQKSEHEKCCDKKTYQSTISVVWRMRGILIARESFRAHSRRLAEKRRNARGRLPARTATRHAAIMQEMSAGIRAPGRQSRDRRGAAV